MKKLLLRKAPLGECSDVPGWVLITLMTAALVVLIRGTVSERLVGIPNRATDPITGI